MLNFEARTCVTLTLGFLRTVNAVYAYIVQTREFSRYSFFITLFDSSGFSMTNTERLGNTVPTSGTTPGSVLFARPGVNREDSVGEGGTSGDGGAGGDGDGGEKETGSDGADNQVGMDGNASGKSNDSAGGGPGSSSSPSQAGVTGSVGQILARFNGLDSQTKTLVAELAQTMGGGLALLTNSATLATATNATATAPTVAPRRFIFSKAQETVVDSLGHEVIIHPCIFDLGSVHGLRAPLHLFTNQILSLISRSSSLYMKKQTDGHGKSATFLYADHEAFGTEAGLDIVLWNEAWGNYAKYVAEGSEPGSGIPERWEGHYRMLATRPTIQKDFAAVLEFDIEQRIRYFANPFVFDKTVWHAKLESTIASHHASESEKRLDTLERRLSVPTAASSSRTGVISSRGYSQSQARSHPYEPYQSRSSASRSSSFPNGSSVSSASGICVICGAGAHSGKDCHERTTIKGRPVIARWEKGVLRSLRDAKITFCFWFNINTCTRPRDVCIGKHECSICGGSHGANSGICTKSK